MRFFISILVVILCFASCKTHDTQYYKSGIEIHPKLSIIDTDSSTTNELRIVNINPQYTVRILFDKFGLWNKTIAPRDTYDIYYIWENVQLFKNSSERYTIITDNTDLYSSAWVFDSEIKDCLADSSPLKTVIIDFFAKGINQVNKEGDDAFYTAKRFAIKNRVIE